MPVAQMHRLARDGTVKESVKHHQAIIEPKARMTEGETSAVSGV